MHNMRIIWINSIFARLIITFLLVIVPLYFLGIQVFQWSRNMLSQQIFSANQNQVAFYLKNLAGDIQHIKELQYDCFSDNDLNDLVNQPFIMSDYDRTEAITRLQARLSTIKQSNIYIQNVTAYLPTISRVINAYGNVDTAGKLEGSIQELDLKDYSTEGAMPRDSDSQILYKGNSLILNATSQYKYNNTNLPLFIIEIQLSKEALRSTLVQSDTGNGMKTLLLSPKQRFAITSDSDGQVSKEFEQIVTQQQAKSANNAISVEVNGKRFLLIYASSDYLGVILARYIPEDFVFQPLEKFQLWFWSLSLLSVFVIAVYSLSTYRFIQKPLGKLVKAFGSVESGDFSVEIRHRQKDEFGFLYTGFNAMVEKLKILIDQVYKQKILAQRAELKQLQSQINPHFLYNSFFILQRRINKGDYNNAEKFCEGLGNYFKFITRSASDEVPLAKEAEHARIYADIQAMRFSNRIKVDFADLPPGCEDILVPRLILQPIIENAFEHGLEDKESDGMLSVSFEKVPGLLNITIEDNGEKLSDSDLERLTAALESSEENAENTGVLNIHKRIRLALGASSGITASRGKLGGLRIDIHLEITED